MARMTKREILEVAIKNAEAAGDMAAAAQMRAALDALPASRGGDKLRAAAPAPKKSARETLKVKPRRPARELFDVKRDAETFDVEPDRAYDDDPGPEYRGNGQFDDEVPEVEVPQALSPAFRVQYKEYLQQANAVNTVGKKAAELAALLKELDETAASGGTEGHDPGEIGLRSGKVKPGEIPGAGGWRNTVGGSLEDVSNAPYIGGLIGTVARPLAGKLRNTTAEGRRVRQLTKELELLGANMLVKGTGQISDYERKQVREAWGLSTSDMYADQNLRIGAQRALKDAAQAMADLESAYPDVAEYTRKLGHSSGRLREDLGSAYDPMSVYEE